MRRIAVLSNEIRSEAKLWINSLEKVIEKIDYKVFYIDEYDVINKILDFNPVIILAKPSGLISTYKILFDEVVRILSEIYKFSFYPNPDEIYIYENKRFLSFWLEANKINHPRTYIFYNKNECYDFLSKAHFPLVAKLNIGASGHGIKILKSNQEAKKYVKIIFSSGVKPSLTSKIFKANFWKRLGNLINNKDLLKQRIDSIKKLNSEPQKHFVIFQEYIEHSFEWRVVRIGDSFFAHKKLKVGDKASGSLIKEYGTPPPMLLDFVKEITDKYNFYSQAVDIFESKDGNYLINEMQCIFGQSDPYQMAIEGEPGRYILIDSNWKYESGSFNNNESYDLRLDWILSKIIEKV